jgi:acyl carrier protein
MTGRISSDTTMSKEVTTVQSFIEKLERQFDDGSPQSITTDTLFRELPGWTSLQALVVIISFDEDYGVVINAEELQSAQTIGDLYQLIRDKQGV